MQTLAAILQETAAKYGIQLATAEFCSLSEAERRDQIRLTMKALMQGPTASLEHFFQEYCDVLNLEELENFIGYVETTYREMRTVLEKKSSTWKKVKCLFSAQGDQCDFDVLKAFFIVMRVSFKCFVFVLWYHV